MTLTPVPVQVVNKASSPRNRVVTHGIRLAPGEITNRATELRITDGVNQDRVQWEPFHETRHPDGSYQQIAVHFPANMAPSGSFQATISEGTVSNAPTFTLAPSVVAAQAGVTFTLTVEGESRSVTLQTVLQQPLEVTPLADGSIGNDSTACLRRFVWRQRWSGVTNQQLRGVWWEIAVEAMTGREAARWTFTWGYSACETGARLGNAWNDRFIVLTANATLTISGCGAFAEAENKVFNSVTRGTNTCTWVLRDPTAYTQEGPNHNINLRHANVVQGSSHCYEGELLFDGSAIPTTDDDREGVVAMAMDWPTKGIPPFDEVPGYPPYITSRQEAITRLRAWELMLWGRGRDADPLSWSGTITNANTGNTGDVDIGFGTMRLWLVLLTGWPAGLGALKRDIRQEYLRPNNNRQFNATADLWRYSDHPDLVMWDGLPFHNSENQRSPDMFGWNGPPGDLGIAEWHCPMTQANGAACGWDREHAMLMVQMEVALVTASYAILRFFRQQEQIWLGNCEVQSPNLSVLSNGVGRSFGRGIMAAGCDIWHVTGTQGVLDTLRGRVVFAWRGNQVVGLASSYYHSPARSGPQPPNTEGGWDDIDPVNPPQSGNLETVRHTFPWINAIAARGAAGVARTLAKRYGASEEITGWATIIAADIAFQVTMYGWLDVRGQGPDHYRAVVIDVPYDTYRNPNGHAAIVGRTVTGGTSGSNGTVVGIVEADIKVGPYTCWALWIKDCSGPFANSEALAFAGSAFACNVVLELGGFIGVKALQNPDNYIPLVKSQLERTVIFPSRQPRPNNQTVGILDVAREANPLVTLVPEADENFLVTGDILRIEREPNWPVLNGDWTITVVAKNTLRLQGCDTSAQPGTYVQNEQVVVSCMKWHNTSLKPYTGYATWQRVAAALTLLYARQGLYGAKTVEAIAKAQQILQFIGAERQVDLPPTTVPRWYDVDEHVAVLPNPFAAEPTAPTGLTARGVGPNTVRLSWANTWAGVFTDIRFRQVNSEPWTDAPSTARDVSQADVGGLAIRTAYEFQIRSRTETWTSPWIGPVTASTQGNPPETVGNLAATGATSSTVVLTWTQPATNSDRIEVEYRRIGDPTWIAIAPPLAPTALTFTLGGLLPGTAYEARVRNANSFGVSVWAGPVSASTRIGAPSAPTGLAAVPTSTTTVGLSWTNTAGNATAIELQYQLASATTWIDVPPLDPTETGTEISGLVPATTYRFRVRAVNASGPSDWAGPVTATTTDTAPLSPTNLTVVGDSAGSITAQWENRATNATSIETHYRVHGSPSWTPGPTIPPSASGVRIPGLLPATNYDFEVRAVGTGGASAWVGGSATTVNGAPTAPTGLTAVAANGTTVNLTWTNTSVIATRNEIRVRPAAASSWQAGPSVAAAATAATAAGLTPGTPLEFQVRALNGSGASDWSASAFATTPPGPPAEVAPDAPANLRLFPVGSNEIDVAWTTVATNALGHEVQFREYQTANWLPAGIVPIAQASLAVTEGIEAGKVYEFRVRAFHATGRSEWLGPKSQQAGMETALSVADWIGLLLEAIGARINGQTVPAITIGTRSVTNEPLSELQRLLERAYARQSEFRSAVGTTWMRLERTR